MGFFDWLLGTNKPKEDDKKEDEFYDPCPKCGRSGDCLCGLQDDDDYNSTPGGGTYNAGIGGGGR